MKGSFTLHAEPMHDQTYVFFGNLGRSPYLESDLYAVASNYSTYSGRVIAHDLLEHKVKHRTSFTVSVQDELHAVGASLFIRPDAIDITWEVANQLVYSTNLTPLSWIQERSLDPYQSDIQIAISEVRLNYFRETNKKLPLSIAKLALSHLYLGYIHKKSQYKGNHYKAYSDFQFIQYESEQALKDLFYFDAKKAVIHFDTDKGIFNSRFYGDLYGH